MIKKERKIPLKILKLEALARRFSEGTSKMSLIRKELANRRAGYRGEKSIDYHLSFLQEKQYYILHDLRLQNERGFFFQLDTLILSPYFITIIDVKNYRGIIEFDDNLKQLVQKVNGVKRGLQYPLTQMDRHKAQLRSWMQKMKFDDAPIKTLIVFSNPGTIIETTGHSARFKQITHSINLIPKIKTFETMHKAEIFSKKDLSKLLRLLIKKHTPPEYDVLKHFKINPEEVIKGVQCPGCSALPMQRMHGKWKCLACFVTSKSAHVEALKDYSFLIGNTITNQQFRDFMLMPSRNAASYILGSMNLQHSGETKGRVYHLPTPE